MRRPAIVLCAMSFVGSVIASGQAPTGGQAPGAVSSAFEVASIKANQSGSGNSSTRTLPGGAFSATNVTVRLLIVSAFRLRPFQAIGGPAWIDSDRFDILARPPENTPPGQLQAMLRTLLIERFKLVTHTETREQQIYALVLARDDRRLGPQLKPSTQDCSQPAAAAARGSAAASPAPPQPGQPPPCGMNTSIGGAIGTLRGGGRTLADLAGVLASFTVNTMVVDRTALTGTFDMELQWTPDNLRATATDPAAEAPSLFTALQEQLGLKLESARGPVEYLVVDGIEQPTPD